MAGESRRAHARTRRSVAVTAVLAAGIAVLAAPAGATTGAPPPDDWLGALNWYREASGLPAAIASPDPAHAANSQARACYGVRTGQLSHSQPAYPACGDNGSGFTSEVLTATSATTATTDRELIENLMAAPFHTLLLMSQNASDGGPMQYSFGRFDDPASTTGITTSAAINGRTYPSATRRAWTFPGADAATPLDRFVAEWPNPLASCPGYTSPAGLPIIVSPPGPVGSVTEARITLSTGAVLDDASERCVMTPTNYANADASQQTIGRQLMAGSNAAFIVPRQPLPPGRHSVTVTTSGGSFAWSFTVVGAPSEPPAARSATPGRVTVAWTAPSSTGGVPIASYRVTVRSVSSNAVVREVTVGANETSAVIDGLSGSEWWVALDAVNTFGRRSNAAFAYVAATSNATPTITPGSGRRAANPPIGAGYWVVTRSGRVVPFGDAVDHGGLMNAQVTDIEAAPGGGYWLLDGSGLVAAYGGARRFTTGGSFDLVPLQNGERATSLSATADGSGLWVFTDRGRVVTFGSARHVGDLAGTALNGPVLGSVVTPSGDGYWMVASDGGVFAFGDAAFFGSMGGRPLNQPVTGLVPSGAGYTMVATDGGVFNFGDGPFAGSLGANPPAEPVVAITLWRA
jgi:hypothetical protein